jgi:hypothetical protein
MRELIATTFLTLDGVMQAPGESDEDVEGDFAYGGWSMTQWDGATARAQGRSRGTLAGQGTRRAGRRPCVARKRGSGSISGSRARQSPCRRQGVAFAVR